MPQNIALKEHLHSRKTHLTADKDQPIQDTDENALTLSETNNCSLSFIILDVAINYIKPYAILCMLSTCRIPN